MTKLFKVACVQNGATADMDASMAEATALARAARAAGAELICLPEYFTCLGLRDNLLELKALGIHQQKITHVRNALSQILRQINMDDA